MSTRAEDGDSPKLLLEPFYRDRAVGLFLIRSRTSSSPCVAKWLQQHDAFLPTVDKFRTKEYEPWWIFVAYCRDYRGFAVFGAEAVEGREPYATRLRCVEIRVPLEHSGKGWATWMFGCALQAFRVKANQIDYVELKITFVPLLKILKRFGVEWVNVNQADIRIINRTLELREWENEELSLPTLKWPGERGCS